MYNDVIIGYAPTEKQWCITGFNPKYQDVKARDWYVMSCLIFDNEDLYNAFAKAIKNNPQYRRDWTLWDEHKMASVAFAIQKTGQFTDTGLAHDFYSYGITIFKVKWKAGGDTLSYSDYFRRR